MNLRNKVLFRFFWVTAVTMIVVMALSFVAITFFDFELPSATGLITMILPALIAGQYCVKLAERFPASRESWGFAFMFTLINFLFGAAIIAALAWQDVAFLLGELDLLLMAIIMAVVFVVYLLMGRAFFAMGARQQAKLSI